MNEYRVPFDWYFRQMYSSPYKAYEALLSFIIHFPFSGWAWRAGVVIFLAWIETQAGVALNAQPAAKYRPRLPAVLFTTVLCTRSVIGR
jgi:hypothetical protein